MIANGRQPRIVDFCTRCGRELAAGVYYLNRARVCRECHRMGELSDEPERGATMLGGVVMGLAVIGWLILLGLILG